MGYVLQAEQSAEVARVHVNRLRRFEEHFKELGTPQGGVFPDSRRLYLLLTGDRIVDGKKEFNITSVGRRGFVWKPEEELPQIVIKLYDLAKEDRSRWQ